MDETPYRKIDKETGKVTDEIVYMTADEEDDYIICQASEELDEEGRLLHNRVRVRDRAEIKESVEKGLEPLEKPLEVHEEISCTFFYAVSLHRDSVTNSINPS